MRIILLLASLLLVSSFTFAQSPFSVDSDSAAPIAVDNNIKDDMPPVNGTSEEAIDYYAKRYSDPEAAWYASLADRNKIDPRNIALRDAEHYWWARSEVQNAKSYMKPYKFIQGVICTIGYSTYKLLKEPITGNTTPPSFREMKYGLKGGWEGLFPPAKK